jgi:hypothetical protein
MSRLMSRHRQHRQNWQSKKEDTLLLDGRINAEPITWKAHFMAKIALELHGTKKTHPVEIYNPFLINGGFKN